MKNVEPRKLKSSTGSDKELFTTFILYAATKAFELFSSEELWTRTNILLESL